MFVNKDFVGFVIDVYEKYRYFVVVGVYVDSFFFGISYFWLRIGDDL